MYGRREGKGEGSGKQRASVPSAFRARRGCTHAAVDVQTRRQRNITTDRSRRGRDPSGPYMSRALPCLARAKHRGRRLLLSKSLPTVLQHTYGSVGRHWQLDRAFPRESGHFAFVGLNVTRSDIGVSLSDLTTCRARCMSRVGRWYRHLSRWALLLTPDSC